MRWMSSPRASDPICWIGWLMVVSGGVVMRRLGHVVEPDDGEVVGDRQAELASDLHRGDGRQVVGGEDRGRALREREQLARRAPAASRAVAAHSHELGVDGDAGGGHRRPVALLAQPRGLEVGAPAEEADAAVPELEQVLGRDARRRRSCPSRRSAGPTDRRAGRWRRPGPSRLSRRPSGVTRMAPSISVPLRRER